MAPPRRKTSATKDFLIAGDDFEIASAGPIEEPMASFYLQALGVKGSPFSYYVWFSPAKMHAVDWALLHNKQVNRNHFGYMPSKTPSTKYSTKDPIRVDQFAPKDNRTQIGIALQRGKCFLVRFIISFNKDRDRHSFMVWYEGEAPESWVGKVCWGTLVSIGEDPRATLRSGFFDE